ncbi:hypothetical protein BUALT_Bualt01G0081000 [Buddleja alternifolia]|uniref:Fungal lipase-like domain-containing protein n=1 Tax=Buddleja alternifolia TaxID=168488 RepID=A0AAV6Y5F6_9LAMI|nr:hypothetical protein BUALT_Bualt01G0081000 [Buddleja alternifolia]
MAPPEKEDFFRVGPSHLNPVDWFFGFRLIECLRDERDSSIFCAVYELIHSPDTRPPQYVVAFRGTANTSDNWKRDYKLNLQIIFNGLQSTSPFQKGLQKVSELSQSTPQTNVWLAGYSQGSAISLLIGSYLVRNIGIHLEIYLFNPPFISPPIEWIPKNLKFGVRLVKTLLIGKYCRPNDENNSNDDDPFGKLSSWFPNLFVNRLDPICGEYIGYFEHRKKMKLIGLQEAEKVATKYSVTNTLLSAARGKVASPAAHLIPSANLTISSTSSRCFIKAHKLRQWWSQDSQLESKTYTI